jgi:hypothetical protein
LNLKVNRRRSRLKSVKPRNFQMTVADLIERLPRLSMESVEQLELAIPQSGGFSSRGFANANEPKS